MIQTTPAIQDLLNVQSFFLSLLITVVLIWIIAILTMIKARSVRRDDKPVVAEYEPPQEFSPVFARFIMVSGREGGLAGEVSRTGNQLLSLINLYEDGLLTRLHFINESDLEYAINENFENLHCAPEEKKFLERLSGKVGMSGVLREIKNKENPQGEGYVELDRLWIDFWHKDMYQLALSRGYMQKESKIAFVLSLFAASLTFGVFFSLFLVFIPFVGKFLAGLIMSPVLLIFLIGQGIANIILTYADVSWIVNPNMQGIGIFFTFLSWFAWFLIFGKNMSKLTRQLTPAGLEIVRKLNGYKAYLKSVDRDRLSFSFNKESDLSRNRTSFSWLGVFGMITDNHWDQWYEIAGLRDQKKTTKTAAFFNSKI